MNIEDIMKMAKKKYNGDDFTLIIYPDFSGHFETSETIDGAIDLDAFDNLDQLKELISENEQY